MNKYMIGAYIVAWVIMAGYAVYLGVRCGRQEGRLHRMEQALRKYTDDK